MLEIDKALSEAEVFLAEIDKRISDDEDHNQKRLHAFNILDALLKDCENGFCPNITREGTSVIHHCLIDISAEGYLLNWAWIEGKKEIDEDNHEKRLNRAMTRLNTIFNCAKRSNLQKDIFEYDITDLEQNIYPARNRKAFWSFKSGRNKNELLDYYDACHFIDNIFKLFTEENNFEKKTNLLKEQLLNNLHIANGVDLFRYCFFRKLTYSDTPNYDKKIREQ